MSEHRGKPICIIGLVHNPSPVDAKLEGSGDGREAEDVNRRPRVDICGLVLAIGVGDAILSVVLEETIQSRS